MILGPSVNIIAKPYAYGLRQSLDIIAHTLYASGFRVRAIMATDPPDWFAEPPRDVNIFLETPRPAFYPLARRQVLIPNQEWFTESDRAELPHIDAVVCKTHHARDIFRRLGARTAYASFTSVDRRRPGHTVQREFLALSTPNTLLGLRIAGIWSRHPNWPRLTLTFRSDAPPVPAAANIRAIRTYIAAEALAELQNTSRFHLCMAIAEGFGHKINEGLSCGALVIAIDGAPMNELIARDRGLLVAAASSEPMGAGTAFTFDEADFERTIEAALALTPDAIDTLTRNGRNWYERNDRFFHTQFPRIMRALTPIGVPLPV